MMKKLVYICVLPLFFVQCKNEKLAILNNDPILVSDGIEYNKEEYVLKSIKRLIWSFPNQSLSLQLLSNYLD